MQTETRMRETVHRGKGVGEEAQRKSQELLVCHERCKFLRSSSMENITVVKKNVFSVPKLKQ